MAGAGILIDGKGTTVTHGGTTIANTIFVEFPLIGKAEPIDLTGLDNVLFKTSILSVLQELDDVVISVKANPTVIGAMSRANAALVITLPTATPTVCTIWCQLKEASRIKAITKEKGVVDLTYHVTNLNASMIETGPSVV